MSKPTRWDIDLNRADGTAQRNAAGDMVARLQALNVLVPVEPPDDDADWQLAWIKTTVRTTGVAEVRDWEVVDDG